MSSVSGQTAEQRQSPSIEPRMSTLPTLLTKSQPKSVSFARSKDERPGGKDSDPSEQDSDYPRLLAVTPLRKDQNKFRTSPPACSAGSSKHGKTLDAKKFNTEPVDLAKAALEAFRARQQRIADRQAPFRI
eukprot:TRINITY_DN59473_c0_g1_i1.p1 TRINITY_DN59473_c0_g1~~TRINITY_DN59473_c0_g1_i1.p1  ORF type:complete len:131 (+),score=24.08 TRINITY_DN59473_c0_g1_i1:161-553(+)